MLAIGNDPARLAGQLTSAEAVLGQGGAAPAAMARQALIIQLACLKIAAHPGWPAFSKIFHCAAIIRTMTAR